jgi:hypothetical protein
MTTTDQRRARRSIFEPITTSNSDKLYEAVLEVARSYLQAEEEGSLEFNLMAPYNKQNEEEFGISNVGTQGVSLSEKRLIERKAGTMKVRNLFLQQ